MAVARAVGIAFAYFEYWPFITIRKWFPEFMFGRGPSMYMTTYCNSVERGNSRSSYSLLFAWRLLADDRKSRTAAKILFATSG